MGALIRNVRFCVVLVEKHFLLPYMATPIFFYFPELGMMRLVVMMGEVESPRDSTSSLVRDWNVADRVVRYPPMLRLRPSIRSSRVSGRHKTNKWAVLEPHSLRAPCRR